MSMRHKPVNRDEIKFNEHSGSIRTLPADAVRTMKGRRFTVEPIRKLWAPLLRQLNRAARKRWDGYSEQYKRRFGFTPIKCPKPDGFLAHQPCDHCGREFYSVRRNGPKHCSDRCAKTVRTAAFVKARSERRADNRETHCDRCAKPIEAKRSTMRFCSVKCRVAAHRERQPVAHQ